MLRRYICPYFSGYGPTTTGGRPLWASSGVNTSLSHVFGELIIPRFTDREPHTMPICIRGRACCASGFYLATLPISL